MVSSPIIIAAKLSWVGLGLPWLGRRFAAIDGGKECLGKKWSRTIGWWEAAMGSCVTQKGEEGELLVEGVMADSRKIQEGGVWAWWIGEWSDGLGRNCSAFWWIQMVLGLLSPVSFTGLWLSEEDVAWIGKRGWWNHGGSATHENTFGGMDELVVKSNSWVARFWAVYARNSVWSSMVLKFVMAVLLAWCLFPGSPVDQNPEFGVSFGGLTEFVSVVSRYECHKRRLLFVVGLLHSVRETDFSCEGELWFTRCFATLVALQEAFWRSSALLMLDSVVMNVGIIVWCFVIVVVCLLVRSLFRPFVM